MSYYSTNNPNVRANLKEAVMQSLAPDKGLYMPLNIGHLPRTFIDQLFTLSFEEIGFEISKLLIGNEVPTSVLQHIVTTAINFPAPLVFLDGDKASLELWHGPSLAFKDFGARYMAALMSWFIRGENKPLTILVATSGDTGGAVASGFLKTPGIEVIILYPSGKVSDLQEKQLTTLGENITAIEVEGTFDDCQAMVKEAFADTNLSARYHLSSANSINIARLIPQSFYYFEGYKQVQQQGKEVVFSVPSGNFGNLTAGLMAKKMGLPAKRFIAATNINKIVPEYLETGVFNPRSSAATISNAMDVGNPSNFVRILELYGHDTDAIRKDITGFWLDDQATRSAMKEAFDKHRYICDPHGAIAYKSLDTLKAGEQGIFLETAHPAKFIDTVQETLGIQVPVPESLAILAERQKKAVLMPSAYPALRDWLLSR